MKPAAAAWKCILLAILSPGLASAQVFQPSIALGPAEVELLDATSATHLENARRFLTERQWEEAVDAIRRGMEGESGRFVQIDDPALPDGFQRLIPLREFCQWQLAALYQSAPEALAHYRSLADPLAEQWYRQATDERDERLFGQLVSDAFATTVGDDALLKLGDGALARGEYARARCYYSRIGPNLSVPTAAVELLKVRPAVPAWRALRHIDWNVQWKELAPHFNGDYQRFEESYPDTDLAADEVRARLVLVSILEGAQERAGAELELFRRLHPEARGTLAGREGNLAELLAALAAQARSWPAVHRSANWETFAGNPARDGQASEPIDPAGKPRWVFDLPRLTSDRDVIGSGRLRVADDMKGLLSYFPIVVGNIVLVRADVSGQSYVAALDLRTGQRRWQVDAPRGPSGLTQPNDEGEAPWEVSDAHAGLLRHVGVARYTLTASGNQLFARMGSPVTAPPARGVAQILAKTQGFLMGYDLATEGKPLEGFPIRPQSGEWSFEGTPLTDRGRLYVVMRQIEQGRCQIHVACFALATSGTPLDDARDDSRPTGRMLWRTKVCSAGSLGTGDFAELSHQLLTLDEGTLFLNTNLGVVAALDAEGGAVRWLCKYPRATFRSEDPDRHDDHFFRDLTPCLPAGDQIIIAPADCERLFALDRCSGRLVWTTEPGVAADVVHLLGTSGDWLLASGDRLYWIDLHSGEVKARFPNAPNLGPMHAAPSPRGLGRGLLAGDNVYWPTREAIYVFRQTPARTAAGLEPVAVREISLISRGATGGNLVFAGGTLLIASGEKLYAFDAAGTAPSAREADNVPGDQ